MLPVENHFFYPVKIGLNNGFCENLMSYNMMDNRFFQSVLICNKWSKVNEACNCERLRKYLLLLFLFLLG